MRSAMRNSPTPIALRAEPDMPGVWSMFSMKKPMSALRSGESHSPSM